MNQLTQRAFHQIKPILPYPWNPHHIRRNGMKKITGILWAVLVMTSSLPLMSQDKEDDRRTSDTITVTANSDKVKTEKSGRSIIVIDRSQIEQSGASNVKELLVKTRGLALSGSGSFGGATSVFMHGAKSEQLLVLIDGIPANDAMNPNRGFNFATLSTLNIDRIEIIYGAQSVLYGSGAAAGVINIITAKGDTPRTRIAIEGGSHKTFSESVELSGQGENTTYSIAAKRTDSDGISKATRPSGSTAHYDNDGIAQTVFSARLSVAPNTNTVADFTMRFEDSKVAIDDDAFIDDPDRTNTTRLFATGCNFSWDLFRWYTQKVILSYSSTLFKDSDKTDPDLSYTDYLYEGTNRKAEWQNIITIIPSNTLTLSAGYTDESGSQITVADYGSSQMFPQKSSARYLFAYDRQEIMDTVFLSGGARVDNYDQFGSAYTYNGSALVKTPVTGTLIRSSVGNSFKAPSLYQLYSSYGNRDLKPEKGFSIDGGVEQPLENIGTIGLNLFYNRFHDMIGFSSKYNNTSKISTKGYETYFTIKPHETITLDGSYTYTISRDLDKNTDEPRRPRNKGTIGITYQPNTTYTIQMDGSYIGSQSDTYFPPYPNPSTTVTLHKYALLNMCVTFHFFEKYNLFVKLTDFTRNSFFQHNLPNSAFKKNFVDEYTEAYGYQTTGAMITAGLSATL
jgi:vitamin B12 transporter